MLVLSFESYTSYHTIDKLLARPLNDLPLSSWATETVCVSKVQAYLGNIS